MTLRLILGGLVAFLALAGLGGALIAKLSLEALRNLQANLERDE